MVLNIICSTIFWVILLALSATGIGLTGSGLDYGYNGVSAPFRTMQIKLCSIEKEIMKAIFKNWLYNAYTYD